MTDLTHWHKPGDEPSTLDVPPACCSNKLGTVIDHIDSDHARREEAAVHAERQRIVNAALDAIEAYASAAGSLMDAASVDMIRKVAERCANAVKAVGCICPRLEITSFGGGTRFVPGRDARCGLHARPEATP